MTFRVQSSSMKNYLDQLSATYEESLPGSVGEFYLKNRGISPTTAKHFRLGLVTEGNHSPEHVDKIGRLSIPYITQTGVVQIRFRAIPEDGIPGNPEASPKMLGDGGFGSTLYNVLDLRSHDYVCLLEGESDTWSCYEANMPGVGVPGAESWKKAFARAFRFRRVFILQDNDDKGAGKEFAKAAQASIPGSKIIPMPAGYDVNKVLQEFGPEALRERVGIKDGHE